MEHSTQGFLSASRGVGVSLHGNHRSEQVSLKLTSADYPENDHVIPGHLHFTSDSVEEY